MIQKRNTKIDVIKGIAIILVVLGHCGFPATDYIYLFHMAVFFIASGYCWNEANVESLDGLKNYFLKKLKGLYLPYVIYNTIFEVSYNILIDLNIYTSNPEFSGKIRTKTNYIQTINEVLSILHFDPSSCHQLCGAAWFVIVLFYTTIIVSILFFLTRRINSKIKNFIVFIFGIAALVCSWFLKQNGISFRWYFTPTFPAIFLYITGYFIRKIMSIIDTKKINVPGGHTAGILVVAFLSLIWANKIGSVSLGSNYYKTPLFLIMVSLMGWLLISSSASIISKCNFLTNMLTVIGQNSIHILFLHFLSFKIINYIQVFLYHEETYLVATFPILHYEGLWWVVYAIVGVGIPTIIGVLIKKGVSLLLEKI